MTQPVFIPKKVIILLHEQLIDRYGGTTGVRDENLLESAIEQPKTTFDGAFLHESLYDMAAAYGFHLCMNHPFLDGNKRIALVAMDVFLQKNGYEIIASEEETYEVMMKLSTGQLTKEALASWLKANSEPVIE
jgi:death-on-curing protein